MSAIHSLQWLYTMSGFAVGLLVGLTGVGGGSLMTPLLILLFGIHPATAVGTDLLYAAATKTAGGAVHGFGGTVDWRIVRRLALGSVPTTVLTILVLGYIGIKGAPAQELISSVLTFALLLTALTLIFRERIVARYAPRLEALSPQRIAVLTVIVGGILGVLVSISSVGAGAIGVTALVLLYPKLPTVRIVGSDIVHAVPLTLVAGIGHWFLGSIDWQVFTALIFGSVPGILIGSYAAARVPETALRFVLAATLVAVATKLSFDVRAAHYAPNGSASTAATHVSIPAAKDMAVTSSKDMSAPSAKDISMTSAPDVSAPSAKDMTPTLSKDVALPAAKDIAITAIGIRGAPTAATQR